MNTPATEMQKARSLPAVTKVILSSDFTVVVVNLRKDESLGLVRKNTLFFPAPEFQAELLEEAIRKIV